MQFQLGIDGFLVLLVAVVVITRHIVDVVVAVILGEQVAQFSLPLFKRIGDILQEDQAQHDVLVVGCVQIVAQLVGSLPEFIVEGFQEFLFSCFHRDFSSVLVSYLA